MPYKNDYIMRIIEQLGLALARVLFHKGKEEYDEAEAIISNTALSLLGLDITLLRSLTLEGIAGLLRRPDATEVGPYLVAAELLSEQGDIDEKRFGPDQARDAGRIAGSDAGYDCNYKALSLYLECYLTAPEIWTAGLAAKVAGQLARLRPYVLPATLQHKLFLYHEGQGNYAEAENLIHHLLEDRHPGAWEDGLAFYDRLQAKSDDDLAAGSLPRDEVEEGLQAFKELAGQR